jgi:hypothetical protein
MVGEVPTERIRQAYLAAMTLLDTVITDWPTLTANQKNAWIAANFDAVMRILRGVLRVLGKMLG